MRSPIAAVVFVAMPWVLGAIPGIAEAQSGGRREPVVIDGSSTVFRISRAAQQSFNDERSDVTVVVNVSGTGGGFPSYFSNKCDIVDASRAASKAEEARAKAEPAHAFTRFLVGYDGITLVVNPKNDFIKSLTVGQLKKLWEPEAEGKIRTWKDIDAAWPDRPITFYCPDTASGTFDFFTEKVVGKEKSQRKDVQPSPNDDQLVRGVAGNPDAIGYFGYAYFVANKAKLRAVPIRVDADAPAVLPTPATILDETYAPLSRPLYIYVRNEARKRPEVETFLNHYIDKVETLATRGGFVPPKPIDRDANLEAPKGANLPVKK